jgi:hypothetical protein
MSISLHVGNVSMDTAPVATYPRRLRQTPHLTEGGFGPLEFQASSQQIF